MSSATIAVVATQKNIHTHIHIYTCSVCVYMYVCISICKGRSGKALQNDIKSAFESFSFSVDGLGHKELKERPCQAWPNKSDYSLREAEKGRSVQLTLSGIII